MSEPRSLAVGLKLASVTWVYGTSVRSWQAALPTIRATVRSTGATLELRTRILEPHAQASGEHAGGRVLVALIVARAESVRASCGDRGIEPLVAGDRQQIAPGDVDPRVGERPGEQPQRVLAHRVADRHVVDLPVVAVLDVVAHVREVVVDRALAVGRIERGLQHVVLQNLRIFVEHPLEVEDLEL